MLLTNGWDTAARDRAIAHFGLEANDFHTRHGMVKTAFETGRLNLDQYLHRTVFCQPRGFKPADRVQICEACNEYAEEAWTLLGGQGMGGRDIVYCMNCGRSRSWRGQGAARRKLQVRCHCRV